MKKMKLIALLMACIMMVSTLGACGGGENTGSKAEGTKTSEEAEAKPKDEKPAEEKKEESKPAESKPAEEKKEEKPEAAATDEIISEEEYSKLQGEYAKLVDVYNSAVELYDKKEIEANDEITETLHDAKEIIDEMGDLNREDIKKSQYNDLANLIQGMIGVISKTADSMEVTTEAAKEILKDEPISDDTYDKLKETYGYFLTAYDAVVELYKKDEVAADEATNAVLQESEAFIKKTGTLEREGLTEANAIELSEQMIKLFDELEKALNKM